MSRRTIFIATILILLSAAGTVGYLWYRDTQSNRSRTSQSTPHDNPTPGPNTAQCIANLPDSFKIGQKILPAVYSEQIDQLIPILKKYHIGGVILMDSATKDQIASLRDALGPSAIIAVDQEGGTVQRYTAEGIVPGASDIASSLSESEAYDTYLRDNTYLKGLGITTNFAPVVDVQSRTPSPLPGRMYSDQPQIVTKYAAQSIRAAESAGITPVIKHFPGIGSATGNSDYGSATTDPLSILETRDLLPYKQLATQKPDVMVSNAIVPDLTDGQPAIWSSAAIKLLRDTGYTDAVVYSDSLTAKAIPGSLEDASTKAWSAGIDIVVIVQTREQTSSLDGYLQAITTTATDDLASGSLQRDDFNQSISRILARKNVDPCSLKQ